MPAQRKEGKRLWGGYLDKDDFDRLDRNAKHRGFQTRTDFLVWFAQQCEKLTILGSKSGSSEEDEKKQP